MSSLLSTTIDLPDPMDCDPEHLGYAPTFYQFINILDDDSLLNIFYLCRPVILDKDEEDPARILEGGNWDRERWWYKFTQVCRRWRYLVLASASHLGLSLVCTRGTPVAKLLAAHSAPTPLPVIIDHLCKDRDITSEDKKRNNACTPTL